MIIVRVFLLKGSSINGEVIVYRQGKADVANGGSSSFTGSLSGSSYRLQRKKEGSLYR